METSPSTILWGNLVTLGWVLVGVTTLGVCQLPVGTGGWVFLWISPGFLLDSEGWGATLKANQVLRVRLLLWGLTRVPTGNEDVVLLWGLTPRTAG